MKRIMRAFSFLLMMGAATIASAADGPREVTVENVRVGFGEKMSGGQYKSGTWTPVWVDLKAGVSRFEGTLVITVPDDHGTPTKIRRSVVLPANDMVTVPMFVRPGSQGGEIGVEVEADGRIKANWPHGGTIDALKIQTAMVVTAGQPAGLGDLSELSKFKAAVNATDSPLFLTSIGVRDGFPSRWYGFDAADVVVLDTNDKDVMVRINNQSQALREWVRQGGHLVIAVGQNWQSVKDSPLEPLLPGVPSGRIELSDPGLIDQFAGTGNKPILPPDSKTRLLVTKFEGWEARGGIPLAASSTTPLVLRGPYGFGRVTMLGLDVDQKPFASWEDKKLYWDKVLDLRGRGNNVVDANPNSNQFYRSASNDLSTKLNASLQRFPGVRLVPFGWVAFLVFLYILLIGPGDYLFLRKVVKRMEMTWITFPAIVITVSALAYAAAYYLKGTELKINKIDAVDVDQTTGLIRGTTWLTLFSPQNRDYDVGIDPLPPENEPVAELLAPESSPKTANAETITTWFGAADNPFGGGNGMSMDGRGYSYAPMSEPEELTAVRIPIWSTKSFTGRWSSSTTVPLLESDLIPDGPDRIRGTVTNVSKRSFKGAVLFFGRYVYLLNDIAPGATAVLGEGQTLAGYMDGLSRGVATAEDAIAQGRSPSQDPSQMDVERPDLVRTIMFHDGLGSRANGMPNVALRSLDLTDHLDLRRPILVTSVDGPGARLRLKGNANPPKVAQTTVLRVILPLKPEPDASKP